MGGVRGSVARQDPDVELLFLARGDQPPCRPSCQGLIRGAVVAEEAVGRQPGAPSRRQSGLSLCDAYSEGIIRHRRLGVLWAGLAWLRAVIRAGDEIGRGRQMTRKRRDNRMRALQRLSDKMWEACGN